jgi:hypothetical protein
MMMMHSLSLFL